MRNGEKSILNKKIFYIFLAVVTFCIGIGIPLGIIFLNPRQPIDNTSLIIDRQDDQEDDEDSKTRPILSINNGKVIYIGEENPTQILIPQTVDAEIVTKIDGSSLPNTVETLILPDTITDINPGEFSELDKLTSIVIDNGEYGTQDGAIYKKDENGDLTTLVSVPAGKTGEIVYASTLTVIGERAFENTNLDTLTIPSGTTTINAYAFNGTKYEKIVLPSTITSLSANAFAGMGNLSEIVLNSSISAYTLPEIKFTGGSFAWYKDGTTPTQVATMSTSGTYYVGRSAISTTDDGWTIATIGNKDYVVGVPTPIDANTEKLSIPATIGAYTITGVGNGTNVITNIDAYKTVELKSGITTVSAYAFSGIINNIVLPSTVTSIGAYAFAHCGIKSVNLSNVTSLGAFAFSWGYELTTVTLSTNLTTIPNGLFEVCRKLTTINLSSTNVNTIGSYAFSACESLASISLPSSLRNVGTGAFSGCLFTSITIPSGVSAIPEKCFRDCINLVTVSLPTSITSIGDDAFLGTKISTISLPSSLTTIGRSAFLATSLTSITIPSSVTSIGDYCFASCMSLSSITINGAITSINGGAFQGCSSLTSITIPNSVKTIEMFAFDGCTNLSTINFGSGVSSISSYAFANCTSLRNVNLPASMARFTGGWVFQNCVNLTLTLRCTSVVVYSPDIFQNVDSVIIKVPSSLVSAYQSTKGWNNYAIQAI